MNETATLIFYKIITAGRDKDSIFDNNIFSLTFNSENDFVLCNNNDGFPDYEFSVDLDEIGIVLMSLDWNTGFFPKLLLYELDELV